MLTDTYTGEGWWLVEVSASSCCLFLPAVSSSFSLCPQDILFILNKFHRGYTFLAT